MHTETIPYRIIILGPIIFTSDLNCSTILHLTKKVRIQHDFDDVSIFAWYLPDKYQVKSGKPDQVNNVYNCTLYNKSASYGASFSGRSATRAPCMTRHIIENLNPA